MESQEFVIKGTMEGMIKILQKDFDMPFEEAKFFIYVMLNQYNREAVNAVSKEALDLWYLTEADTYEGEILNTHLSINFTTVKMDLYHLVFTFGIQYLFRRGVDPILLGADLIYILAASIKKIADTDYCIYSRIIELCVGNKDNLFNTSDIVTADKDGKCNYQGENWKCTHLGQEENCTCNEEKVSLAFRRLEEQKVIKRVGDRWMLVQ